MASRDDRNAMIRPASPRPNMTNLEFNDAQTEALIRKLDAIIRNDRYFLSPRITVLREILAMLRADAERPAPLPPPLRTYEPPSKGRYRRRR
jgi:hypothetical protein